MKKIALLASALALSACSMSSNAPPVTIYRMQAEAPAAADTARALPVIVIPEPDVPSGFDTDRIALYLEGGQRMDYYAGAAWPDHLGKFMQGLMIRSVQGAIATTPDSGMTPAYALQVRINDLEPVYAAGPQGAPQLKVSLTFRLVSLKNDKVVADFTEVKEAAASANTLTGVTTGIEALLQAALGEAMEKVMPHLRIKEKAE